VSVRTMRTMRLALAVLAVFGIKYHALAKFLSDIKAGGFTLGSIQRERDGSVTILATRIAEVR